MLAPIIALGLAALATAAPTAPPTNPHYPPTQVSKGFQLVLNVTDHSKDLKPSVHNSYVASLHVGAGQNLVGQTFTKDYARTFYVNGTAEEVHFGNSHLISDAGSIPEGFGLLPVPGSKTLSQATLNGGSGDEGIVLTRFPSPYTYLNPQTFAACKEKLDYYGGKEFVVLKQANTTVDKNGKINYNVPKGCAPVTLLPECHKLEPLPEGASWNHDNAADSACYKKPSAINWSSYGP